MARLSRAFLGLVLLSPISAHALPAFPGAEGFGTQTPGGRGGPVLVVTTLAGSGSGSFRAAMMTPGPRIIVFRVSGVIDLGGDITLTEAQSHVTVLGQSSPGGITLVNGAITNYQTNFHDAIFRFLRLRAQAGELGEQDFETLVLALAQAWPAERGPVEALQFEGGRLSLQRSGFADEQVEALRQRLASEGWTLQTEQGRLILSKAGR